MEENLWCAFNRTVNERKDKPALLIGAETYTFCELHDLALRAAAFLTSRGVASGDVVALQAPKCAEIYALMLGCLRLGAIYCCLDPKNPSERSAKMLARLQPRLLITTESAANIEDRVLAFDPGMRDFWPSALSSQPTHTIPASHPAYIMFTSGSTGEPKGAVISHYGVLSLMSWGRELIESVGRQRFAAVNPVYFDNSVFDFYCGLLNGAALAPVDTAVKPNPVDWVASLNQTEVSVLFAVPTFFMMLDDLNLLTPETLPSVKFFMFGGEGFPLDRLRQFENRFHGRARFINVYGPTETSCICSSIEITPAELNATRASFASLGRMHKDFSHAILDENLKPVATGDSGELWIGGPCVGLGYYRNPEETARRFIQDPRQDSYRAMMYRTGDLVNEDAAGKLWFVGRADNQVKIGGHRVELEEIDKIVQAVQGVRRAVSALVPYKTGDELCVAYAAESEIAEIEIRAHCRANLPSYMQPARVIQLAQIPSNSNGKADRLAVKTIFLGAATSGALSAADPDHYRDHANNAAEPPPILRSTAEWESALSNVLRQVLQTPTLDPGDNFFDLGATSLLLRRAHAVIQETLFQDVAVIDLFSRPNIRSLAQFLHERGSGVGAQKVNVSAASRQADALRALAAARRNPERAPQ